MIKTFTPTPVSNLSTSAPVNQVEANEDQENELFYQSIQSRLDKLKKDPSHETIDRILMYSKNFKGDI